MFLIPGVTIRSHYSIGRDGSVVTTTDDERALVIRPPLVIDSNDDLRRRPHTCQTGPMPLLYRCRISLVGSDPEIWRLLEVDPALSLDALHDIIQISFGWRDQHLHQFMEGNPFDPPEQLPRVGREPLRWSMPDPFEDDEPDLPEQEWTIAAVFDKINGPLFYEYDFGDSWVHAIELVEKVPDAVGDHRARLLRGERRGPFEDSGGLHGYQSVQEALADSTHPDHHELTEWVSITVGPWSISDPAALDVDRVNRELVARFDGDDNAKLPTVFHTVIDRLPPVLQRELVEYARRGGALEPVQVDATTASVMVEPYAWLLRRVGAEGITLSKAGWLPPEVVGDAMRELGWEDRWYGTFTRESQTMPVLDLRASAQRFGLLRKFKGKLLLSSVGKRLVDDPVALWNVLAQKMVLGQRHQAERDVAFLLALELASGRGERVEDHLSAIAFGLGAFGWSRPDGGELEESDVWRAMREPHSVLRVLGAFTVDRWTDGPVTDGGRMFARAMLQS